MTDALGRLKEIIFKNTIYILHGMIILALENTLMNN